MNQDTHTDAVPMMPREYFLRVLTERTTDQQLLQFREEMGELLVAVSQYRRGRASKEEVATEISDVELMMQWVRLLFRIPDTVVEAARTEQHRKFRQFALTFAPPKDIPLQPIPLPSLRDALKRNLHRAAQDIHTRMQEMKGSIDALQRHVDEAQNDGPLGEREWTLLRNAARDLRTAGGALSTYLGEDT